jgi:hypothetical protein
MSITKACLVMLAVLAATPVMAQGTDTPVTVNSLFGRFGYTTERAPGKDCVLVMTLDRSVYIDAIPQLKHMGLLNSEYVTQTMVNLEPVKLSLAFASNMMPATVHDFYDTDKKADKCVFKQVLKTQDDYGNDKTVPMFSFGFSRALHDKINWDNFSATKLMKVSSQFKIETPIMLEVQQEDAAGGE